MPRSLLPYRLATTLAIAVALACGPPERSRAETASDAVDLELLPDEFSGSFDERFSTEREIPTFARPQIAAMLLSLPPLSEEEASVVAAAEPDPPHHPSEQAAAADDKSPMQVVKELLISPAQGAQPPSPAKDELGAAPVAPRQEDHAPAVAAAPAPDEGRRTAETVPPRAAEPALPDRQASAGQHAATEEPAEPQRRIAAGPASYYEHPGRTASGEVYDPNKLTAAHKKLPFGTRVRVVNRENGRSVVVRINDRAPREMPFVIDLSRGSARALGITPKDGIAPVAVYKAD